VFQLNCKALSMQCLFSIPPGNASVLTLRANWASVDIDNGGEMAAGEKCLTARDDDSTGTVETVEFTTLVGLTMPKEAVDDGAY